MFHNRPMKSRLSKSAYKSVDADLGSRRATMVAEACRVRAERQQSWRQQATNQYCEPPGEGPLSTRRSSMDYVRPKACVDPSYGRRCSAPHACTNDIHSMKQSSKKKLLPRKLAPGPSPSPSESDRSQKELLDDSGSSQSQRRVSSIKPRRSSMQTQSLKLNSFKPKRSSMDHTPTDYMRSSMPVQTTQPAMYRETQNRRASAPFVTTISSSTGRRVDVAARFSNKRVYV